VQDSAGQDGDALAALQLLGPRPTTSQQALATNSTERRIIPVYAQNGTPIIGPFVVGGTSGVGDTPPHPPKT
jgi:hypothetical protein